MNEVLRDPMPGIGHLLGSAPRHALLDRFVGAAVALACLTVLSIAAWLTPSPSGVGTHTELFPLQPCTWIEYADMPCPTCGMTTAFAHAADGHLIRSLITQPMGGLLAIATALAFWVGLYIAVTGSPIGHVLVRMWRPSVVWILAILILASWGYKIWAVKGGIGT